jgi:hypothetical protein
MLWSARRVRRFDAGNVHVVGDSEPVPQGELQRTPVRFTGMSAIKTHLTLLFGLALCGLAFSFELGRAEGGNELSWAYVFEWPLLGLFAIYMWWKILHPGFTFRRHKEKPTIAPEYEGMLAAWQEEVQKIERDRRDSRASGDERVDDGQQSS